jgi:predicted Fe-Mo cluster-binding NifX family protein
MKIAISASSPDIEGQVDPRFGRCAYFLIVDPETLDTDAVENPYVSASGGAGIQAAQLVAAKGVKAVLTGSCGPNAYQTLSAAGVEVVTGVTGPIREATRSYLAGEGTAGGGPNVPPHFGMGQGMGGGRGQGRGSGMGQGRGQGRGGGMGQGRGGGMGRGQGRGGGTGPGRGRPSPQPGFPPPAPPDDLNDLREQSRLLRERLNQITEKIAELEKNPDKE